MKTEIIFESITARTTDGRTANNRPTDHARDTAAHHKQSAEVNAKEDIYTTKFRICIKLHLPAKKSHSLFCLCCSRLSDICISILYSEYISRVFYFHYILGFLIIREIKIPRTYIFIINLI